MGSPDLSLWWEPDDRSEVDDARGLSQFVNGLPAFNSVYASWLEVARDPKERPACAAERNRGEADPDQLKDAGRPRPSYAEAWQSRRGRPRWASTL